MRPLISFNNVSKTLGYKMILKDISFKIYPKEIFGLIGSSGAGKTTLLRTLIGFYHIDKGDILFEDKSISHNIKLIRQIMGFASQESCFYNELTVKENLKYFGKLHQMKSKKIEENTKKYLDLLELSDSKDQLAKNLSGGMRRRLDLACALIYDPKILIMDEPTTGLDPVLRKHIWHVIKKINAAGMTIIVSSHLLEEIEHMCTRVGMINRGKLLIAGTPDQLKYLYSHNEEIHLETYPGRYEEIVKKLKEDNLPIMLFANKGHKLIIYTPRAETMLHDILHILEKMNERLLDVDVNKPSLSEVFEAFTQNDKRDTNNNRQKS